MNSKTVTQHNYAFMSYRMDGRDRNDSHSNLRTLTSLDNSCNIAVLVVLIQIGSMVWRYRAMDWRNSWPIWGWYAGLKLLEPKVFDAVHGQPCTTLYRLAVSIVSGRVCHSPAGFTPWGIDRKQCVHVVHIIKCKVRYICAFWKKSPNYDLDLT